MKFTFTKNEVKLLAAAILAAPGSTLRDAASLNLGGFARVGRLLDALETSTFAGPDVDDFDLVEADVRILVAALAKAPAAAFLEVDAENGWAVASRLFARLKRERF